ncbi:hypothetical protein T05_15824 [Trichinella murrelli]|uniref:Uncharacterized protein n=1 Tax=Trichinella murrelli TaxID=144512 RepID=A0A0V0SNX0_9BILA|nr:hypothetical protein T05_15824 [Trichinella murrelli]
MEFRIEHALYALPFGVTSVEFQCFEAANPVDC